MVDPITLGAAQRLNYLERGNISRARDKASSRLSTGRKVNNIQDNPHAFLLAKSLIDRSSNLLAVKSDIGRGIDTLLATQNGLDAAQKLTEQLKGIAGSASSASGGERANLARQFDTTRSQLNNLVGDVSFLGANLLSNPAGTLNVRISDNPAQTFTVAGAATDAAGLGVGQASTTYNNFATTADINAAVAAADSAISSIQSQGATIVSNAAILSVREKFSQNLADTLQSGAQKMVVADLNKEGARLLSATVRDALSVTSMRITAQSDQLVVKLVQGS
ncbi:MAG TPA: hypothetical protein ENI55_05060 [Alphaproteobacteria bacterium]|nr:hypothetical protein [Alphaproteobacteria bacterium]